MNYIFSHNHVNFFSALPVLVKLKSMLKCFVPENVHTPHTEGTINSWGGGVGVLKNHQIKRNVWSFIGISKGVMGDLIHWSIWLTESPCFQSSKMRLLVKVSLSKGSRSPLFKAATSKPLLTQLGPQKLLFIKTSGNGIKNILNICSHNCKHKVKITAQSKTLLNTPCMSIASTQRPQISLWTNNIQAEY